MSNRKSQARTNADSEQKDENIFVSQHSRKPNVASSFSLSTIGQHPSTFAAYKMLQQLDELNDGSSHWVLLSLCKLLIQRPGLTVKELVNELEILCPNATETVTQKLQAHGYFD